MKPAAFEYHAPRTLEEAVAVLARVAPEEGRVLAGGQTLVPAMALRLARPGHLVDINGVAGLDRIDVADGVVRIGACVRHAAVDAPGPMGRLMALMKRHIAHGPIRARGTFCGSLANADAASEWCLLAVAMDARVEVRSARGARILAVDDLLLGSMMTTLEPDEMIVAARIRLLPERARVGFHEFARRAGDFAQVMAVAVLGDDGPRLAIGSLEPRPRRLPEAEAALANDPVDLAAASRTAAAALLLPEEDAYLRALAETSVRRALEAAA